MSATTTHRPSAQNITVHRLVSVAAAGVVGLVGWTSARLGGVDLAVRIGDQVQDIGAARVMISAIVAAVAGWGVLALFERRIDQPRRARRLWRWVGVGAALLSLAGPLAADAPSETRWWLVALHTSVAATFITLMTHRNAPVAGRR